jgi:HD superfamily phosphohydrolase
MSTLFEPTPLSLKNGKQIKGDHDSYEIDKQKGFGGSGVVYKARSIKTSADVAIKFFLPVYELKLSALVNSVEKQEALERLGELHKKEIQCLKNTHHQGIVRIIDSGSYQCLKSELSTEIKMVKHINFFVMEYIPGNDINVYLSTVSNKHDAVTMLIKLMDALIYLHDKKQYLHTDLRASNIIIRENTNDPVIIDFALYKNFNELEVSLDEITILLGDWDLFPKSLQTDHRLKLIKERKINSSRRELKSLCFPMLDLFNLGLLLERLLPSLAKIFSVEEQQFLDILISELTSWDKVAKVTSRDLREQLYKLDPGYSLFMGVEELTPHGSAQRVLQLPHRVITLSSIIEKLINTHSFRRLRSINQLAFVDLIYPGAGYRRYLHCLRAYGYCGDFIESLTNTPRFRRLFDPNLARQAMVMSLLHDINHFPLLHVFQEAPGNYIHDIDLYDLFCDGRATQDNPSIYSIIEQIGISQKQFKDIFEYSHPQLSEKGYNAGFQIIKSLIDSGADVDKLAYLEDDSRETGVAYGRGIDVTRLITSATIVSRPDTIGTNESWHIGFREEGLPAVESLVMARYWMFRAVYWHRVNRAVMTMLLHVIKQLYVHSGANASEYVIDTMWKPEEIVLYYLNEKYKNRFGVDSIINSILKDPTQVYQRVFSLQGAGSDRRENNIYDKIISLNPEELEALHENLSEKYEKYIRDTHNKDISINSGELLIDIPHRRLDTAGDIYIALDSGTVKAVEELQGPILRTVTEFEKLTKRIRVFVDPKISRVLGADVLKYRPQFLAAIEEATQIPEKSKEQVK